MTPSTSAYHPKGVMMAGDRARVDGRSPMETELTPEPCQANTCQSVFGGPIMKFSTSVVAVALLFTSAPAWADPVTINDIIALTNAQVGDDAIVAKIHSSNAHFDLNTDQMIDLRKRGVSPAVLAAMIGSTVDPKSVMSSDSPDPLVPHPLGVYYLSSNGTAPHMERLEPTSATQVKTGGLLGFALTSGIASMSLKIVVPGASAKTHTAGGGTFYFYVGDGGGSGVSNSFLGSSFLTTSPNDFALVKFDQKSDKREAKVGKVNIGGAKTGVMDKDRLPFSYETVKPGVFKITITGQLARGEYGFLYLMPGQGTSGAAGARIFDFGVN